MSGVVGNLFGEKSVASQSQAPTAFNTLPRELQGIYTNAIKQAQGLSGDSSMFAPAAMNADQLAAADMIRSGYTPIDQSSFGNALSIFTNPFEDQVVNKALTDLRTTGQGLLGDIGSGATASGGFGGTRQAALEGDLIKNLSQQAADTSAQIRSGNYNTAVQNAINAIGTNNQIKSQQQTELGNLGGFLQQQQTATNQAPVSGLSFLLSALQGLPTGGGQTASGGWDNPGFFGRTSQIAANFGQLIPGGGK